MKKKKSLWGIGLTVTYVCFAAGMITLAVFASSSKFDFVSESYYEDSLSYQDVIDAKNRAKKLIQKPQIILNKNAVLVEMPTELTVRKCTLKFYSPKNSQEDTVFEISGKPVSLKSMRRGFWKTTLTWYDDKNDMYIIEKPVEISE